MSNTTNNTPNKAHILLADDDPLARKLFGSCLSKKGYEVLYAGNGQEAREAAVRAHPDLIILDIHMPGDEDGFATAVRLKNESKTSDIPIVFLTNDNFSPETEKASKEMVVADYIHKSIDPEEFVKRIKAILGK